MASGTNVSVREPFRLGPWRVDPGLGQISNGEQTAHVEPRTMAVLCHLASRPSATVSRDELLDSVWKTRFVVEETLTRCISQLRQLLGDDPRDSRYIQTVPKLGYRLLVEPESIAAPPVRNALSGRPSAGGSGRSDASEPHEAVEALPAVHHRPMRIRIGAWVVPLVMVLAAAALWWLLPFTADRPVDGTSSPRAANVAQHNRSVAILPFVVLGGTDAELAFADGMTDDVIQLLATVPGIRVSSRTSSFYFKGRDADLGTIGRELGVAHVLEGSVRRQGNRIRVKAQLIDADTDVHIWSQEFDRELFDVFEVQKEIAVAVAQRLNASIDSRLLERGPAKRDMAAYQLYVEGRMAMEKFEEQAMKDSIAMLEAAVELDPRLASAWSSLALARWVRPASANMTPEQVLKSDEAARAAALRALELNDSVSGAQFVLADSARVAYSYSEAETRYRAALAAMPGDSGMHIGYGNVLGDAGRVRDSLAHLQLSFRLDPLSPVSAFFLARGHLLAGNYDEARNYVRRSRELGFQSAVLDHMEAYLHVRTRDLQAARAIWTRSDDAVEGRAMQEVLAALEDPARRPNALAAIAPLPPWHVLPFRGRMYAALLLGERDVAWQAAVEGVEHRLEPTDAWWLPEASVLRTDGRFPELAERMNLLAYWREYGWPDACSESRESLTCN